MKESWKQYNGAIIPIDPPHINVKESRKTLLEESLKLVHILHDGLKILISLNKKNFGMSYAINSII